MNKVSTYYDNVRLRSANIKDYLKREYPEYDVVTSKEVVKIEMENLLQKDYGDDLDCTLTSITECIMYYSKNLTDAKIYPVVEKIAKKYFYNGKQFGTIPVFIKNI